MKNIYLQVIDKYVNNLPLALATVIKTMGSSPQKPGVSALFGPSGLVSGTIGGGVLEGKVQKIAAKTIHLKESGLYQFKLNKGISEKEEAICGGQVSVLIDTELEKSIAVLKEIRKSIIERTPGVFITLVKKSSGTRVFIDRFWTDGKKELPLQREYLIKIEPAISNMFQVTKPNDFREFELSGPDEKPSVFCFLELVRPLPKLIIAGAGHIGKVVAQFGQLLDFEVTVIDDRPEFANSQNIPYADNIIVEDIGKAMQKIEKTSETYIVIVTRGHKDDSDALKHCIGSGASYLGMIGSKTKIAVMRKEFIKNGWATRDQWDEIFAPIGLDIKSQTVEEIAVSIAAQLIQIRNKER